MAMLAAAALLDGCTREPTHQAVTPKVLKKTQSIAHVQSTPFEDALKAAAHGDFVTARTIWESLAAGGDNGAANALGDMYVTGHGVPISMPEALRWYRKAADAGDARGEFMLGLAHDSGEGVAQNYGEALYWYRRAAHHGSAVAEEYLGRLYASGRGVAQDDLQAHMWFNLAAAHGDQSALKERDEIEARLSAPQLEESQEMARLCTESQYRKCGEVGQSSDAAGEVPLKDSGGVFKIPVVINDAISLDFIIDSGASDVNIPADVALTLIRTGTISPSDSIGSQTYTMADGSTAPSERFVIHSLKLGSIILHDVPASIGDPKGVPLLGQSFLSRFSSWSIDNGRHVLLLGASTAQVAAAEISTSPISSAPTQSSAPEPQMVPQQAATFADAHPSFDCAHPKYVAEATICADPALAALDNDYATKWTAVAVPLRAKGANAQYLTVRSRARSFLAERNACGASTACISQAYRSMLDFLGPLTKSQQ
jgi:hypothetical protein